MYLKNEVLKAINTKENRRKIATALNVGEMGIVQAINRNPPHSSLTKLAALKCISGIMKKDIKDLLQ
jgi:hypothetical protein